MTSLGSYLLMSLVFVFFTMVEFALVLVLKEVNERRLHETIDTMDKSKSENLFSRRPTELQNNITTVSPLEERRLDLERKEGSGREQISSRIRSPGLFVNLILTRKLDIFSFLIYHLSYLSFNLYYWRAYVI